MDARASNATESTALNEKINETSTADVPFILLPHLDPVSVACFTFAYAVIFPISLTGNILNICAIRRNPSLKTTTNFLILNLSTADLITTFLSHPYKIASLYIGKRWFPGDFADFFCKFLSFTKNVTLTSSIATLVLISIDRFCAVVYPMKKSPIATHKRKLILATWALSIGLPIQTFINQQNTRMTDGHYYCYFRSHLKPATADTIVSYAVVKTFFFFSVPIAIMGTLYAFIYHKLWSRKVIGSNLQHIAINKRVTKAMVAIVINFIVCWLPTEIMTYLDFIYGYSSSNLSLLRVFSFWMWNVNSATNPWLYIYFNKALRRQHINLLTDITILFPVPRRVRANNQISVLESPGRKNPVVSLSASANVWNS